MLLKPNEDKLYVAVVLADEFTPPGKTEGILAVPLNVASVVMVMLVFGERTQA
jgi:hypothetical protein